MNRVKRFSDMHNESISGIIIGFCSAYLLYKFLRGLFLDIKNQKKENAYQSQLNSLILSLKKVNLEKFAISEFSDRYFIRININNKDSIDLRLLKDIKILIVNDIKFPLNDKQYNDLLKIFNA